MQGYLIENATPTERFWSRWLLIFLGVGVVLACGADRTCAQAPSPSVQTYFDAAYSPAYEDTMVVRMREGINRYFERYGEQVARERAQHWQRDLSSRGAYQASVAPNRERLRTIAGVVGERQPAKMEQFGGVDGAPVVAETEQYRVRQVRWPVLDGLWGEGLLLTPKGETQARVVALPDADQTPEQIAGLTGEEGGPAPFARRLAASGVQVVVPALINRRSTYSKGMMVPRKPWRGSAERVAIATNQPHREWIYRQAYVMGRHIIGLEVQKVLGAVDWFEQQAGGGDAPTGVAGYGEGGLLALYASALDGRIGAAMVSGYFGPREELWKEPLYRNVWGVLEQFGDAEIASLVAPRALVIEHSAQPDVEGPPPAEGEERPAAVAGRIETPPLEAVQEEVARLRGFFEGAGEVAPDVKLVHGDGPQGTVPAGSTPAMQTFARRLGVESLADDRAQALVDRREGFRPSQRQERQVHQMSAYLQGLTEESDRVRYAFIEGDWSSPQAWDASMEPYRDSLYEEVIGRVSQELLPPNPRQRKVFDRPGWTGYETVLDVWPDVFAWGLLALPKDLEAGEQRPVVVMQHGYGGTPTTPLRVDSYNRVLPKLVEEGFIVFAPHNPYQFNVRQAMPLKASVFSPIIPQNQQIVNWLGSLEHVDPDRIGYYGKSWGGRAALRLPALIDAFSLSICSAYMNQWPRKAATVRYENTYMRTSSIGVYEFNQGNTFGHAELAQLVAPRPFMVESGYHDGVAPHEWVGYEFAKVERLYDLLGIGSRTRLGFFDGGHEIDAPTTFPFLREQLHPPSPGAPAGVSTDASSSGGDR